MAKRRIGFDGDAMVLAEPQRFRLRETRMHLQLVDGRRLAGFIDEPPQMLGKEIRNAGGANHAFLLELQQRLPCFDVLVDRGERPMDEIQVEMVESEIGQRRVKGHACRIIALIAVAKLGRDEHLVGHAGGSERIADPTLVVVCCGRVDMAVSDLQSLFDGLLRGRGGDLEDTESDLRNRNGIGKRNAWNVWCRGCFNMFHIHSFGKPVFTILKGAHHARCASMEANMRRRL